MKNKQNDFKALYQKTDKLHNLNKIQHYATRRESSRRTKRKGRYSLCASKPDHSVFPYINRNSIHHAPGCRATLNRGILKACNTSTSEKECCLPFIRHRACKEECKKKEQCERFVSSLSRKAGSAFQGKSGEKAVPAGNSFRVYYTHHVHTSIINRSTGCALTRQETGT
jgi:hypothetical protein